MTTEQMINNLYELSQNTSGAPKPKIIKKK